MTMLRNTGKVAVGTLSAALVTRLGWPALGALGLLVLIGAALVFWVLSSDARVGRVTQILIAWRGGAISPTLTAQAITRPSSRRRSRARKC